MKTCIRTRLILTVVLAALVVPAAHAATPTPAGYSRAVTQICAGALLFEGSHQIGTRAGAIDVSRDIRATGSRRLRRVDAVSKPVGTAKLAARWIAIQRRLVETYASTYVRIWYAIEHAHSPQEHAKLPALLHALIGRPARLQGQAAKLEQQLQVPDCTGGQPSQQPINGPELPGWSE